MRLPAPFHRRVLSCASGALSVPPRSPKMMTQLGEACEPGALSARPLIAGSWRSLGSCVEPLTASKRTELIEIAALAQWTRDSRSRAPGHRDGPIVPATDSQRYFRSFSKEPTAIIRLSPGGAADRATLAGGPSHHRRGAKPSARRRAHRRFDSGARFERIY